MSAGSSNLPERLIIANPGYTSQQGLRRVQEYHQLSHHGSSSSVIGSTVNGSALAYPSLSSSDLPHSSLSITYQPSDALERPDGSRGYPDPNSSRLSVHSTQSFSAPTSSAYHISQTTPESFDQLIKTASQCYTSLNYSQVIFILLRLKLTPDTNMRHVITVHFGLGLGYYKLSLYESSTLHFLKAEGIAKENRDSSNICLLSYYLGEIEYVQNKFLAAAGYLEICIDHYDTGNNVGTVYNVSVPSLSSLVCKRGTALRYASKVMEAIRLYRKGVELAKASNDLEDELSAHTSLGNLYQSLGEYGKAVEEYKETLDLAEKMNDKISLGWAHGNIGNAYLGLMKRDKALDHLQAALRFTFEHEPYPQAISRAYNNIGTAYQSLNDLDRAKEFYELALNQAIYGNDLPGQARVYGNLGNLLMLQNKHLESISHYTETLSISRDRATQITAYHNRGCARYERAETERKKYLEAGEGNSELRTGQKSNLVYIGTEVQDCEEEHKFAPLPDFLQKYYKDSKSDLERVVKHHEQTFQDIKGSQRGLSLSVSLFETNSRTFQRIQDCSFFLGQWQQALVYGEQSRSRTLGELLLGKHAHSLPTSFRTPLDLPQIISIVQRQHLPVVYMTYTGSRLLVWVLTPLCDAIPVNVSINLFQATLDQHQFEDKSFDHLLRFSLNEKLIETKIDMYSRCNYATPTLLNKLHDLIAKPLLRILKSVLSPENLSNLEDLVIIPDSYTKLIPISALQDPLSKEFLGDRLKFHSMASLLTMGIVTQFPSIVVDIPTDSSDMCIVGNPTIPKFTYAKQSWNLGHLPYAEEEAQRVAHTLGTVPILGNEALKDVVISKLSRAKVVHIATHGSASSSFLVFAGSNPLSLSDESFARSVLLFPEDIEKLTLQAALVVLSSCDSGRGAVKADGIQGIARSFLLAGAHAVLTSLWRVPDESASFFMYFFYRYLVDGLKSLTALQKAKLSIRCYTKYSEYIHWSGYQLQGREIQFTSSDKEQSNDIYKRLGSVNVFPRLNELLKLKKSLLTDSKYVPSPAVNFGIPAESERQRKIRNASWFPQRADVQLLIGSLATRPYELAADYINDVHDYYTGGIYWIPGYNTVDITIASLEHMKQLLLVDTTGHSFTDLTEHLLSISQPVLLVLDRFFTLPLSHSPLSTLLHKTNVHVIISSHISLTPSKLDDEVHKELNRGVFLQELKPLQFLSSMQRIVYNIMKQFDLTPMNEEQSIIESIETCTCGHPMLIDITDEVLKNCVESCNGDCSDGLMLFYNEIIIQSLEESKRAFARDEKNHHGFSERKQQAQETTDTPSNAIPLQRTDNSHTVLDDLYRENNPAIIYTQVILRYINLSHLEYVLLCSLSTIGSVPVHTIVIDTLEKLLMDQVNDKGSGMELQKILKKYKLLIPYPQPVIKLPENIKPNKPFTSDYLIMPPVICESLKSLFTDQDKIVYTSLLYYTLNELHSPEATGTEDQPITTNLNHPSFISLHCVALRCLLLEHVSSRYLLYNKDVFHSVVERYVNEKIDARNEDGLMEILAALEIN